MTDSNSTPTHQQITQRAYEIFIERGQPAGQDLAHWLEAEKQLQATAQKKNSAASTAQATQVSNNNNNNNNNAQTANAPSRATQPAAPSNGSNLRAQGNGRTQARATARK